MATQISDKIDLKAKINVPREKEKEPIYYHKRVNTCGRYNILHIYVPNNIIKIYRTKKDTNEWRNRRFNKSKQTLWTDFLGLL